MTIKPPPKIVHHHRPKGYKQLIADATRNVRTSGRAASLLLFYGDQASGFTPALKLVEDKTGIASNKVSEIRQELVRKGLIQYDSAEGFIFIDWMRLKFFALLDEPMSKGTSMAGVFSPVSYRARPERKRPKKIRQLIAEQGLTPLQRLEGRPIARTLSPDEMSLFEALEDMTEAEYAA